MKCLDLARCIPKGRPEKYPFSTLAPGKTVTLTMGYDEREVAIACRRLNGAIRVRHCRHPERFTYRTMPVLLKGRPAIVAELLRIR